MEKSSARSAHNFLPPLMRDVNDRFRECFLTHRPTLFGRYEHDPEVRRAFTSNDIWQNSAKEEQYSNDRCGVT